MTGYSFTKMKFWFFLISTFHALATSPNGDFSIAQELKRQKRDLIGWNRTQNLVNQYTRNKTAGGDKKTFAKQYKQSLMKLHKGTKQELEKKLQKAMKMIRKRRKRRNLA